MNEYCTKPLRKEQLEMLVRTYARRHQSERNRESLGALPA